MSGFPVQKLDQLVIVKYASIPPYNLVANFAVPMGQISNFRGSLLPMVNIPVAGTTIDYNQKPFWVQFSGSSTYDLYAFRVSGKREFICHALGAPYSPFDPTNVALYTPAELVSSGVSFPVSFGGASPASFKIEFDNSGIPITVDLSLATPVGDLNAIVRYLNGVLGISSQGLAYIVYEGNRPRLAIKTKNIGGNPGRVKVWHDGSGTDVSAIMGFDVGNDDNDGDTPELICKFRSYLNQLIP
jgi:hypothetical protein